jgi:hypothetical protein
MAYIPPTGWVEELDKAELGSRSSAFHRDEHCPAVMFPDRLRPVDKPYSAKPCPTCAKRTH